MLFHSFTKGILDTGVVSEAAAEAFLVVIPREEHPTSMRAF